MNQHEIFATSQQLVIAVKTITQQRGMSEAETQTLVTMAMLDLLSIKGDPMATVERLRDLADLIERRVMLN